MIEKTKRVTKLKSLIPVKARRILGNIYSVLVVMLGWTMLRADSPTHLWSIIRALAGFGYINTRMGIREFFDNESFIIAIIALIFALPFTKPLLVKLYTKLSSKYTWFEKVYKPVRTVVIMLILAFTVLTLSSGENGVFEYFRY